MFQETAKMVFPTFAQHKHLSSPLIFFRGITIKALFYPGFVLALGAVLLRKRIDGKDCALGSG